MKKTILICLIIFASKSFAQSGYDGIDDKDYTSQQYADTVIDGWKVKVNMRLNEEHRVLTTTAEGLLSQELAAIGSRLPVQVMAGLKETPIWLEYGTPDGQPMQYLLSSQWLAMNYYDTKKENSIEIVVPEYAATRHDSLPLLRMFAYAYQHGVIGVMNEDVKKTYDNALTQKLYPIPDSMEGASPFKSRVDYFVSISTAYFTDVAYAPYNRKRLKEMDPKGYELVEKLWKVKG